jgi:hypothetical protein
MAAELLEEKPLSKILTIRLDELTFFEFVRIAKNKGLLRLR